MSESKRNSRNTKSTQNRNTRKSTKPINNRLSNNLNNFYNGMGNEITGLILIGFGFLIFAGVFTNRIGKVGRVLRDVAFTTFGVLGYLFPVLLIILGFILIFRKASFILKRRTIGFLLVLTTLCIFSSILPILENKGLNFSESIKNIASSPDINHGGIYGYIFALPFMSLFGEIGTNIFGFLGLLLGVILLMNMTIYEFIGLLIELFNKFTSFINEKIENIRRRQEEEEIREKGLNENLQESLPEIEGINLSGLKETLLNKKNNSKRNTSLNENGYKNSKTKDLYEGGLDGNLNSKNVEPLGMVKKDDEIDTDFAKRVREELEKRKKTDINNNYEFSKEDNAVNNNGLNNNIENSLNERPKGMVEKEEGWIAKLFGSNKNEESKGKTLDNKRNKLEDLNNELLNSNFSNSEYKKKSDFKFDAKDFEKESEKLIGDVIDEEEVIKAHKAYLEKANDLTPIIEVPDFIKSNEVNNLCKEPDLHSIKLNKNYNFDLENKEIKTKDYTTDTKDTSNINDESNNGNSFNSNSDGKNEDSNNVVEKDIPKLRLEDLKPIEPIFEEEQIPEEELDKIYNDINPLDAVNGSSIEDIDSINEKEQVTNNLNTTKSKKVDLNKSNMSTKNNGILDNKPIVGKQLKMGEKLENKKKEYKYPPVSLLRENTKGKMGEDEEKEIVSNAEKLQETLMSFGVEAKVLNVSRGPSVTRYELQPKAGIKVSKITNLSDDIALSLAAAGVRIEAPIPGKAAVGIEIPNKDQRAVFLREVIDSDRFKNSTQKLSIALGEDISGESVVGDMARFPHVLIAGATGSGKSVCINSLIVSLLYKYTPEEVRLIMVDPKVVELSVYNGIPHLLIPVVTDPKKATGALHWAVTEMTRRYQLFAENGVKNLEGYNALYEKGKIENKIPYIVIIVDELADLMMVAANEVEDYILRLSQMARAAGMHLVIATQRPSVDVITGVIKANIPSRISFAVSSYVDSKTILDQSGAEKLLGKGDMLYYPVGAQKPRRVQGAFISEEEVEEIVNHIKETEEVVEYDESVLEHIETGNKPSQSDDDDDELMDDAIAIVVENNQASTSFLQRKLKIGYSRAARIMDSLEARGVISGPDGSKPRRVLWKPEDIL